jgi:hypothetical protein
VVPVACSQPWHCIFSHHHKEGRLYTKIFSEADTTSTCFLL